MGKENSFDTPCVERGGAGDLRIESRTPRWRRAISRNFWWSILGIFVARRYEDRSLVIYGLDGQEVTCYKYAREADFISSQTL